ncbi:MAG: zf-HC2 domain-containing protein [Acidimicrobiia bacterium]
MMCQELVERITEYFEMAMPAADRISFEAHVAECPFCAEILEQFRGVVALTAHLRAEHVETVAPHHRDELLTVFRAWSAQGR